jgi:serpin B
MSTRPIGTGPMGAKAAPAAPIGHHKFAFDLFHHLSQERTNIFFSPLSICTALAMAYAGSEGRTRIQIAKVCSFNAPPEQVASDFQFRMVSITQPVDASYEIRVANALWAQQGATFDSHFLSLMRMYYSGDVRMLDFADPPQSCTTINQWIAEKTAGMIRELLQPADIDALTRLVLTNALYFKGDWSEPFRQSLTTPDTFTTARGTQLQVPMMRRQGSFRYIQHNDLQLLDVPYQGDQLSMLIVLPQAGAPDPWSTLSPVKLQQLRAQMKHAHVELSLPRFRVDERLSLRSALFSMGMPDAFARGVADFSGISGRKEWSLSAVVHQAVIDVNEKGTEAAAASGVKFLGASFVPQPQPVIFRVDHPFLYMIIHKPSDSILFLGRLADPPADSH